MLMKLQVLFYLALGYSVKFKMFLDNFLLFTALMLASSLPGSFDRTILLLEKPLF